MGYILLIDNNKGWTIEPTVFHDFLSRTFKVEVFDEITDGSRPYSYEWQVTTPVNVGGFLHKNGDSIHLDGAFLDCIDFVLKLRSLIPPTERLLFFDDSYNHSAVLDSSTTQGRLVEAFSH